MSFHTAFWAIIMAAFFGYCVGGLVNYASVKDAWEREAVKAGHAEFYLDANNERQWRWKEPK